MSQCCWKNGQCQKLSICKKKKTKNQKTTVSVKHNKGGMYHVLYKPMEGVKSERIIFI